MTIDEMIKCLGEAKAELGGDKGIYLEIHCQGKIDFLEFDNLQYSRLHGLTCEVKPTWWMYKD